MILNCFLDTVGERRWNGEEPRKKTSGVFFRALWSISKAMPSINNRMKQQKMGKHLEKGTRWGCKTISVVLLVLFTTSYTAFERRALCHSRPSFSVRHSKKENRGRYWFAGWPTSRKKKFTINKTVNHERTDKPIQIESNSNWSRLPMTNRTSVLQSKWPAHLVLWRVMLLM